LPDDVVVGADHTPPVAWHSSRRRFPTKLPEVPEAATLARNPRGRHARLRLPRARPVGVRVGRRHPTRITIRPGPAEVS
jgi:hypothetical protein